MHALNITHVLRIFLIRKRNIRKTDKSVWLELSVWLEFLIIVSLCCWILNGYSPAPLERKVRGRTWKTRSSSRERLKIWLIGYTSLHLCLVCERVCVFPRARACTPRICFSLLLRRYNARTLKDAKVRCFVWLYGCWFKNGIFVHMAYVFILNSLTHTHTYTLNLNCTIFELIQPPICVRSCHAYVLAYLCGWVCVCVCVLCVCVNLCVYVYICAGGMQVRGRNCADKSL